MTLHEAEQDIFEMYYRGQTPQDVLQEAEALIKDLDLKLARLSTKLAELKLGEVYERYTGSEDYDTFTLMKTVKRTAKQIKLEWQPGSYHTLPRYQIEAGEEVRLKRRYFLSYMLGSAVVPFLQKDINEVCVQMGRAVRRTGEILESLSRGELPLTAQQRLMAQGMWARDRQDDPEPVTANWIKEGF
jgi:hypothetical protein